MKTDIIVAIIGAAGVVIAAIIGVIHKKKEKTNPKELNINQNIAGNNNTQTGIQINKKESDYNGRKSIITQNNKGTHNTQVGLQYNYEEHHNYGLSPSEATNIAIAMFREYYPQLQQQALQKLEQLLWEKLKCIPPENIIPPTAKIAVPTIQKASITEEQEIRELYANLLASSMNSVMKNGVHPGFVEIINQLSPDEAKILNYFFSHNTVPTVTLRAENDKHEGVDVIKNFSDIGEKTACENAFEVNKYFDNLIRLGLIVSAQSISSLTNKSLYEPLKKHPAMESYKNSVENRPLPYNKAIFNESYMYLSDFGKAFCVACLGINNISVTFKQIKDSQGDNTSV